MSFDLFLSAFVSIFVIADPFGTSAVFSALTKDMDRAAQKKIAIKAVIIAVILLTAFSFAGRALLEHMGISLPAFRVAGGLLLFVTGFRMIMGFHDPNHLESNSTAYKDRTDIAVFPMAIPLLAGPGCMTATLMFSTSATSFLQHGQVIAAIAVVQTIAFFCLMGAAALGRFFGPTGNGIIARIMGILLAAMAVQFTADGLHDLIFARL